MTKPALKAKLESAMQVLSTLSNDARAAGDASLMYAANRAWHQLYDENNKLLLPRGSAK